MPEKESNSLGQAVLGKLCPLQPLGKEEEEEGLQTSSKAENRRSCSSWRAC